MISRGTAKGRETRDVQHSVSENSKAAICDVASGDVQNEKRRSLVWRFFVSMVTFNWNCCNWVRSGGVNENKEIWNR